ncbi:ABC transporter permease [Gardnerella vaginalis]|uniref:Multidrug DMT transporter permease n=1 Tax=Gardnerella vaginalis TaxID=2702 RepID=A0A2K1STR9_GARVA|nr:ABC transporter permease [Gardnerella vaginalis]PNS42927.1 multidrug DMT transporter permease [Gardnerella vaginalis]
MNQSIKDILYRSWIAVVRKPRRSAMLMLIITLVLTSLVSQAGVIAAVQSVQENINNNIGLGFNVYSRNNVDNITQQAQSNSQNTVTDKAVDNTSNSDKSNGFVDYSQSGMSLEQAKKFSSIAGVKTSSYESETLASARGMQIVAATSGPRLDNDKMASYVGVTGTTSSRLASGFQEGLYNLDSGKHIDTKSSHSAIVHKAFADKNKLHIGSEITLYQGNHHAKVSIVGIFSGKMQTKGILPSDSSENRIVTDIYTAFTLSGAKLVNAVRCVLNSEDLLNNALIKAKELSNGKFDIEDNSARFSGVLQSVKSVKSMITMIFVVLGLVGILILGLVLVFFVRSRIHEVGVFMALGINKISIAAQMIAEIIIISAISACLSLIFGASVSRVVGNFMFSSIADSSISSLHIPMLPLSQTVFALLIGFAMAIVALLLALIPLFTSRPRAVLSAMS